MLKDFYVLIDLASLGITPSRDLLCDNCSAILFDELNGSVPFWAFFYETEEKDIILSRFLCKECKESLKTSTLKYEEREIYELTFEEAPQSFRNAILEILESPESFSFTEVSEKEFYFLMENPFLLRFWK